MGKSIVNIREYDERRGRDLFFKAFLESSEKKGIKIYNGMESRYAHNLDNILAESDLVLYREDQIKEKIYNMRREILLSDKKLPDDYSDLFDNIVRFSKKAYDNLKSVFRKKTQFLVVDPKEDLANKWNSIKLARKINVPVPITYLANRIGKKLKFPFVIKHKKLSGGRGNKRINNESELLDQINMYGTNHHILQDMIKGPLYEDGISGYIRVIAFGGNTKNCLNVLGAQAAYNMNEDIFVNNNRADLSFALTGRNKKKRLSKNEEKGLCACGLEKIDVPDDIILWSSRLGAAASEQGSQFNTIDFSYCKDTNQHYFLGDINKSPGMGCLNALFGTDQPTLKGRINEAGKILADEFERCFYN